MKLAACGSNSHGQLAVGDTKDRRESPQFTRGLPTELHDLVLAFGGSHTLASTGGNLYVTGNNQRGQLGLPTSSEPITSFRSLPLEAILNRLPKPSYQIILKEGVKYELVKENGIASSWETSFVAITPTSDDEKRKHSDYLLVMGANDWGEFGGADSRDDQTGLVPLAKMLEEKYGVKEPFRILSVSAGPRHVIVRVSTTSNPGILLGWGASRHGQLDFLPSSPSSFPTPPSSLQKHPILAVGKDHSALVNLTDLTSTISVYGQTKHGQSGVSSLSFTNSETSIISLDCTWLGTYVLTRSHTSLPSYTLYASGSNSHGQLGFTPETVLPPSSTLPYSIIPLPPNIDEVIKISCGSEHVVMILKMLDGAEKVVAWGWNEHGNCEGFTSLKDAADETRFGGSQLGRAVNAWGGNGTSWLLIDEA